MEELKKAEEGALQEATQREEEAPRKTKTPSSARTGRAKKEIKRSRDECHLSCEPFPRSRKPLKLKPEGCRLMCVKLFGCVPTTSKAPAPSFCAKAYPDSAILGVVCIQALTAGVNV